MSEIMLLYSTFARRDEAISISRALIGERLIACANIAERATSIYRWQGEICEEPEVILFAKTTKVALPAAMERLAALHPYDNPCILAYPASGGSPAYASWVEEECR